ncbi:MAG: PQQ-dependent sugar dehydrogenase [Anaerolineae bacterium]
MLIFAIAMPVFAQETPIPVPAPPVISPLPSVLDPSAYQWTLVADGFDSPVGLTYAPDGSGRLFVWEQGGMIWIIGPDGSLPTDPFLDISTLLPQVVSLGGYTEQGLLGVAFHPNYAANGQFFVNYTDVNGDTMIVRYTVSADNPNVADPASAVTLLTVDQPFENHNGGDMAFGPDGYLYISLGDGGSQGDPFNNAQSPNALLGKILRIDVNAETYVAPPDNPFASDPAFAPEVYMMGFRNPWRFSFDRATGDIYIADVGEWLWEEIDVVPAGTGAGMNFAWNLFEGRLPRTDTANRDDYTMPAIVYSHSEGCSVTGGYVYRGAALPAAYGVYFFGDYCNGVVWNLWRNSNGYWQAGLFQRTGATISAFGQDEAGELYMVDYKGSIHRLSAS